MSKHHPPVDESARGTLRRPRRRLVWALCAAAAVSGCGRGSGREPDAAARLTPALPLAREALQAALDDWKAGRAPGRIEGLSVPVEVVDQRRRPSQTLEEYEILGETPAESVRCFAVRLKLSRPEAEERVRYVVVGIDPLWVFRQEDFNSICQWECPPEEEPADASATATGSPSGQNNSAAGVPIDDAGRVTAPETPEESNAGGTAGGEKRSHHDNHVSADGVPHETGDRGRK